MGELAIDDAQVDAQLLLDVGHGQDAEAVAAHAPIEAHALEGHVHGVVADEAGGGALALEDEAAGAADGVLGLEERRGLAGEGNQVLAAVAAPALHALSRGGPQGLLEVELLPAGGDQLDGAHEGEGQQFGQLTPGDAEIVGGGLLERGGALREWDD